MFKNLIAVIYVVYSNTLYYSVFFVFGKVPNLKKKLSQLLSHIEKRSLSW